MIPSPLSEVDTERARKGLTAALEHGGDYADLYFEYRVSAEFTLENQRIKSVGEGITQGLGVRVLCGDATGYAYTESLEQLAAAAKTAGQIATAGGSHRPVALSVSPVPDFYPLALAGEALGPHEKISLLRRADAAARNSDRRIVGFEATLSEDLREVLIATSDGRWVRDYQPLVRLSCRAIAQDGARRQVGSAGGGGRFDFRYFAGAGHTPEDYALEAARMAIVMLDAREAPAGERTVVLGPADSGILIHEAVGHGLEADFNRKRTSSFTDRIGERVASPLCTVVDDATVSHSRGSTNVDDEGNDGRKNVLIEEGVLKGYLHDRISARHFGCASSGNGRRQSFRHAPMPRMTNTCVLPGQHSAEEIVRSVKTGVFARRLSNGQVDISNGDFVFSVTEAYLIEDGRLTAPLKGVTLIGNGPEILQRVSMVGSDYALSDGNFTCGKEGQSVPVGMGTPSLKVDRITIGGAAR